MATRTQSVGRPVGYVVRTVARVSGKSVQVAAAPSARNRGISEFGAGGGAARLVAQS